MGHFEKPSCEKLQQRIQELERAESERRRAEKALKESEERYRRIFENLQDVYYEAGVDGTILEVSPSIEKLSKYKREALIGKSIYDIYVDTKERDIFLKILLEQGKANDYEIRLKDKDGSEHICSVNTFLLKDPRGVPQKLIGSMRDISRNKRVEQALRESEERFRLAFHTSPDSINLNRLSDGMYIDVNEGFTTLTGYTREDVVGKTSLSLNIWENPEDRKHLIAGLRKTGIVNNLEARFVRKNGEVGTGLMSARLTKIGAEDVIISITRDITARKHLDEEKAKLEFQLHQAQKMEAIGTLAGGIAHDFNNILSAIIGYTELAQLKLTSDSEIHKDLKAVLIASGRAKDLIKQILTFSRQAQKDRVPVQADLVVQEALKLMRSSLPVTIDICQNLQSRSLILSEPTRLHQIVINLCANAAHAMRENGGTLAIELSDVALGPEFCSLHPNIQPGAYQKLTVSDSGHGMTPDVSSQIFNPFFTTKPKDEGTGLGLSVVHGIVRDCGGTITVDSRPGKGTTFDLYFPIIEGHAEQQSEEPPVLPAGTERILYVDDEKSILDIAQNNLVKLGYTVDVRTGSLEALELFKAMPEKFDLVVTDMTMPQMTGDILARELMKIRPDLPVILCTGFSERINQEGAAKMGIKALLMKPLLRTEMARTIREVLDGVKGLA